MEIAARNRNRRMALFMNPFGTAVSRQRAAVSLGRMAVNAYRNYSRNKKMDNLRKAVEKSSQGRVQNWKQIRQTGTGIKIRRRGRRYRRRRMRYLKRRYRRRRYRYVSWLYRNRPPIYKSYSANSFSFGAFNPPIFDDPTSTVQVSYPVTSIFSYRVEYNFPDIVDNQKADYILYKQTWNLFFHFSAGLYNTSDYTHAYVRVIIFRKYGELISSDLQSSLWSMFKTPALLTSGYVSGFRRRWCKQFGVQLYSDKLLRVSEETNWTTQYNINLYPNIHNRYDSEQDSNHYYYQAYIIAGFGAEDKFNLNIITSGSNSALNVNGKIIRTSYWKFVSGMPLNSSENNSYLVTGLPNSEQSIRPKVGGMEKDTGAAVVDTVNEPRGETGATGSTSAVTSSYTILHDDN